MVSDRIGEGAKALGLALDAEQIALLHRYLDLLEKWNRAYNLTAVRKRAVMEVEHILDSLAVAPYVQQQRAGLVVDIGSGAGLPGMVLAIAVPQNRYLLIDSNGKKTRFLKQAAHELGLAHVAVMQARIEDVTPPADMVAVISRAFASLPEMVQGCRHLLAPGVRLLAMKGMRPEEELALLPADITVDAVVALVVPGLDKARHLVCMVQHGDVSLVQQAAAG